MLGELAEVNQLQATSTVSTSISFSVRYFAYDQTWLIILKTAAARLWRSLSYCQIWALCVKLAELSFTCLYSLLSCCHLEQEWFIKLFSHICAFSNYFLFYSNPPTWWNIWQTNTYIIFLSFCNQCLQWRSGGFNVQYQQHRSWRAELWPPRMDRTIISSVKSWIFHRTLLGRSKLLPAFLNGGGGFLVVLQRMQLVNRVWFYLPQAFQPITAHYLFRYPTPVGGPIRSGGWCWAAVDSGSCSHPDLRSLRVDATGCRLDQVDWKHVEVRVWRGWGWSSICMRHC